MLIVMNATIKKVAPVPEKVGPVQEKKPRKVVPGKYNTGATSIGLPMEPTVIQLILHW